MAGRAVEVALPASFSAASPVREAAVDMAAAVAAVVDSAANWRRSWCPTSSRAPVEVTNHLSPRAHTAAKPTPTAQAPED